MEPKIRVLPLSNGNEISFCVVASVIKPEKLPPAIEIDVLNEEEVAKKFIKGRTEMFQSVRNVDFASTYATFTFVIKNRRGSWKRKSI